MKKNIVFIGLILLIILVSSPKIYSYFEEKFYFKNHIVTAFSLSVIVLDKHEKDDNYYVTFSLDNQDHIDKYNIKEKEWVYKLSNKELFDKIDLEHLEKYAGFTVESIVDTRNISQEEENNFRSDPFLIMSKQEYSKYIRVVAISG